MVQSSRNRFEIGSDPWKLDILRQMKGIDYITFSSPAQGKN